MFPSISSLVQSFGLLPHKTHNKKYGQNFIFDENLLHKIVRYSNLQKKSLKDSLIVEVGPGPGGLTRQLLSLNPGAVFAIEIDPLCQNALTYLKDSYSNFILYAGDALSIDITSIKEHVFKKLHFQPLEIHIVSNLPYNIATELLIQWLHQIDQINSMTLMFQKEVALRLTAEPNQKSYGRLSILAQFLCDVFYGFTVPASAFIPAPKVESSVVHLTPKKHLETLQPLVPFLEKITHTVFQQRRKQIKTPLTMIFGNRILDILKKYDIPTESRAENLTVDMYRLLAEQLKENLRG